MRERQPMGAPFLTGQVFLREAGEKDGRLLYMVVGLIATPKHQPYQGESQYTVMSFNTEQWSFVGRPIDRTQEARAKGLGELLGMPLWRV